MTLQRCGNNGHAERPVPLSVNPDAIPTLLKQADRWVVWRYVEDADPETGEVSWDKPPINARTGGLASSTNPRTWTTFAQVLGALCRNNHDGVGFVLSPPAGDGERLVGVDLDKCRDPETGTVEDWARQIVAALDTYTEVSPSGRGLRLFLLGRLPLAGRKKGRYENYESGRYVTVTGQHVEGTPRTVERRPAELEAVHGRVFGGAAADGPPRLRAAQPVSLDDQELIRRAGEARGGDKFLRLWGGDRSGYGSASEADLALLNYLAFWCGPDEGRLADLFAQSGLYRSKWNREDYRKRTIAKALRGRTEFYSPGQDRHHETPSAPEPWGLIVPLASVEKAAPFPLDVLPPHLVDFVDCVATALACPQDYVGVPLLALASGALGARRALEIKPGWLERPSIYAAVIGHPGSAKSPALKVVAAPVYAEQNRLKAEWDRNMEDYEQKLDAYEKAKKSSDGEPPEKPKKPALQRLYASDTTVEALAPILLANPQGITIIRDELTAWVASMNQYRSGRGADRQFFLAAWAGEPLCVDRKGGGGAPVIVPHPLLSVIGCLPPDLVGQFRDQRNLSDGFLDRMLFSYPDPGPAEGHNDYCILPESAAVWRDALTYLWRLNMEKNDDGTLRPRYVRLTAEGKEEWKRFCTYHAQEMNDERFPDHLLGPWSKLKGYGARLALVVHFLRVALKDSSDEDVDGESVIRAVHLVDYFKSHARKVYATMDLDPCAAKAKKVLKWVARKRLDHFTKRDAHNALQGTFKTVDDLEAPLGLLGRHGYIRVRPAPEHPGPGQKPSPTFEVHPDTRSTESTESTE
jgi:hypothetical protein